jgi:hypothetical protein
MAVVATSTVAYSAPSTYAPYMIRSTASAGFGEVDTFNPWPSAVAVIVNYLQRVWDSGGNNWCYYTKTVIDPSPLPGETTPPYTGTISAHSIVLSQ